MNLIFISSVELKGINSISLIGKKTNISHWNITVQVVIEHYRRWLIEKWYLLCSQTHLKSQNSLESAPIMSPNLKQKPITCTRSCSHNQAQLSSTKIKSYRAINYRVQREILLVKECKLLWYNSSMYTSGVTSLGENPVPPVVTIRSKPTSSHHTINLSYDKTYARFWVNNVRADKV